MFAEANHSSKPLRSLAGGPGGGRTARLPPPDRERRRQKYQERIHQQERAGNASPSQMPRRRRLRTVIAETHNDTEDVQQYHQQAPEQFPTAESEMEGDDATRVKYPLRPRQRPTRKLPEVPSQPSSNPHDLPVHLMRKHLDRAKWAPPPPPGSFVRLCDMISTTIRSDISIGPNAAVDIGAPVLVSASNEQLVGEVQPSPQSSFEETTPMSKKRIGLSNPFSKRKGADSRSRDKPLHIGEPVLTNTPSSHAAQVNAIRAAVADLLPNAGANRGSLAYPTSPEGKAPPPLPSLPPKSLPPVSPSPSPPTISTVPAAAAAASAAKPPPRPLLSPVRMRPRAHSDVPLPDNAVQLPLAKGRPLPKQPQNVGQQPISRVAHPKPHHSPGQSASNIQVPQHSQHPRSPTQIRRAVSPGRGALNARPKQAREPAFSQHPAFAKQPSGGKLPEVHPKPFYGSQHASFSKPAPGAAFLSTPQLSSPANTRKPLSPTSPRVGRGRGTSRGAWHPGA